MSSSANMEAEQSSSALRSATKEANPPTKTTMTTTALDTNSAAIVANLAT